MVVNLVLIASVLTTLFVMKRYRIAKDAARVSGGKQ